MTSFALAIPSTSGSLESYIQTANQFPILSVEEERELGRRLRRDNDLDAARQLVLSHLRVVVAIARGYLGYGLPHADLIQEGNIGLMKAVKRFDPERGVRLVSFAVHWIRAEIHEFILRNWRIVKIATTKAQRKLFFNLRSMKGDTHTLSPDEVEAIAEHLNVREKDVIEMETRFGGRDIALEPEADDSESGFAPISYLEAPDADPTAIIEQRQYDRLQSEGIAQALAALDPRSRRIVEARWLRDADDGGTLTLHDLANEFGVSAERIRQIEAKALEKMKGSLAQYA